MIPILFTPTSTNFTTNGVGRLSDAIACTVHEARNGEFELEMLYPVTGAHFSEIQHSSIIVAKPSARRTNQAFRVYKITKPLNGRVTILAEHISYQLSFIPVSPFSAQSLANALNGFKSNAAESCPFTLSADFTSASSYAVPVPTSIRAYLGGQRGSILDVYGGEWEWNNYNCILHKSRGQDNGYVIRYGKNLVDLKQEQTIANTYTGIYPYWVSDETMVTLSEKVIHAATAKNFPFQRTLVKDFSDKFDNAPSEAALRSYTQSYINSNGIGVPSVNLSVNFVNLADAEEYRGLLTTANLDLCDTVTVRFEKFGIDVKSKVVEITWNVLKDRYEKIEIGDRRSTLATTIEDQMETITTLATTEDVGRTVDRATGVLNSGRRGHVIINRNAEGWANEILFLDNENLAAARNVLRINMAGIGFSSTGYQGPYYQSWTMDGHFSLGGVNNAFGDFQILDGSGKPLGEWDKDGLKFYDSAQHILMLLNHSGLYLRDTSGGTIAQMTADGLNIYKGVISGVTIDIARGNNIGLYCDGTQFQFGDFEVNDAYGRQVLESTDEMTGMSGEPDSDEGLYLWAGYRSDGDYSFVVNSAGAYTQYGSNTYNIGEEIYKLWDAVHSSGCTSDCGDSCDTCDGDGSPCNCEGEACTTCDGCDGEVTPCSSCDYAE